MRTISQFYLLASEGGRCIRFNGKLDLVNYEDRIMRGEGRGGSESQPKSQMVRKEMLT